MFIKFQSFVIQFICISLTFSTIPNPYCSLKCGEYFHTVCRYEPCSLGWSCGIGAKILPLTERDRTFIVSQHNIHRNRIATGYDKRGGNSESSNMNALSYDEELEFIAQCYANSCQGAESDKCKRTETMSVGQNIIIITTTTNNVTELLNIAINNWYGYIGYSSKEIIESYAPYKWLEGFTQLVWATTEYVGCACTRTQDNTVTVICNYAPSGNIPKNSVYEYGKPCTKCYNTPCNTDYTALCGEVTLIPFVRPRFYENSAVLHTNDILLYVIIIMVTFLKINIFL